MLLEELNSREIIEAPKLERRDLLKMGLVGMLGAIAPLAPVKTASAAYAERRVSFRHQHTGESFSGVYRVGDKYMPAAFDRLNYVLRDFRTGDVFPMDPRVLDIISILQEKAGTRKPFEVLSGYRSPKTNAMLRRVSTGVARNSFHMYGQAMDIRMPGYSTQKLRNIAKSLRAGGVGYYGSSDFVHVDTGTVRSWS
ncbi:MAG: twin-arginine translocation pathway signal protein [Micavibrio sp.]|nr:MAG: twin-arginine translocation pathway signal protein [Micavibrio sp.]